MQDVPDASQDGRGEEKMPRPPRKLSNTLEYVFTSCSIKLILDTPDGLERAR
jgi:hypothetical protein